MELFLLVELLVDLLELLEDGVRLGVALVVEEDEGVVLLGEDVLEHGRVDLVDDACDLERLLRRHPAQHDLLVVHLLLELQKVAVPEEADGGERLDA